jgi:hypothetical protein
MHVQSANGLRQRLLPEANALHRAVEVLWSK